MSYQPFDSSSTTITQFEPGCSYYAASANNNNTFICVKAIKRTKATLSYELGGTVHCSGIQRLNGTEVITPNFRSASFVFRADKKL